MIRKGNEIVANNMQVYINWFLVPYRPLAAGRLCSFETVAAVRPVRACERVCAQL